MPDSEATSRDLERLWERAKSVEMSEDERAEQRIVHIAANGNISDERITVETMRAVRTLVEANEKDTA